MIISVCICAYNCEKTIRKCLNSIISQKKINLCNVRVIIVDDGSTDGTLQIIKEYQKANKNGFRVISQQNKGLAASRNVIIENVKTNFFIFVDADDYLHKKCLYYLLKASKGQNDITVAKSFRVRKNIKTTWFLTKHINKKTSPKKYVLDNIPQSWNMLIKTSFFKSCNFKWRENLNYAEDALFGNYCIPRAKTIGICLKKTYYYIKNIDSMSNIKNNRFKNILPFIKQFEYFLYLIHNDSKSKSIYTKDIVNAFVYEMLMYIYYAFNVKKHRRINSNIQFISIKKDLLNLFKKNRIKLMPPKIWWKKISYSLVIKKYFKELF